MTINIASIVWPDDRMAAVKLYLGFLINVLDSLHITFNSSNKDPLILTKKYLEGQVSEDERNAESLIWWSHIDDSGAIRDFQSKDALMARLALCLLAVKEKDAQQLGENLSWFIEVLGFMGMDVNKAIDLMGSYFDFSSHEEML